MKNNWTLKEQVEHLQALVNNKNAYIETCEKEIQKLTHGGKRKGSGRKKKEPTKVIRIPISKIKAVKDLIKD